MKFEPVTKSIEMFGHSEVSAMTIDATGKMFRTIISGLYSRKIESICRESIANAKDGHIKRGNPERPSYVHAPTSWEPFYSVRDFGCSMDHETVMRRFTAIGWSSKEDSNEEIGTFGLGSKAPFAYTSMFNVTTWLNGEQRVYNAFLNEQGKPMMALAGDPLQSDEEQGLMIRFDVRKDDIQSFHKAIRLVALAHFPCFETNLENTHSAHIDEDYQNFYLSRDITDGPRVQIGCVTYPLDFDAIPENDGTNLIKKAKNLVLRTKIGDLGVVPSREGLEYTEKTIRAVVDYIDGIFDFYIQEIEPEVAKLTNDWDAGVYWNSICNHPLKFHVGRDMELPYRTHKFFTLNSTGGYTWAGSLHGDHHLNLALWGEVSLALRKQTTFPRKPEMVVYVLDAKKGAVKFNRRRIQEDMERRGITEAVYVDLPDPHAAIRRAAKQHALLGTPRVDRKIKMDSLFDNLLRTRTALEQSLKAYGCPTLIDVATLPEPKAKPRQKGAPIAEYGLNNGTGKFSSASFTNINENKFNLVFPLKDRAFTRHLNRDTVRLLAKALDFDVAGVVGVSHGNLKRYLDENPHCVMWTDVFNEQSVDVDALKARLDQFANLKILSVARHENFAIRLTQRVVDKLQIAPPVLVEFIEQFEKLQAKSLELEAERVQFEKEGFSKKICAELVHMVTGKWHEPVVVETVEEEPLAELMKQIKERYPKLESLLQSFNADMSPAIYVLGCDAFTLLKKVPVPEVVAGVDADPFADAEELAA